MNDEPTNLIDEARSDAKGYIPMPTVRVFLAFLAARMAFGLYYLIGSVQRLPIPWYRPLERTFVFAAEAQGLAMEWFGRTAVALLSALLGGGIVFFASGCRPFALILGRRSTALALARAGGLVLLVDFAYFGWVLMHQQPAPLPLPAWYCPR